MDPLRFLVLVFVGAVSVFGIAFSVRGIVVEVLYRTQQRRGSPEAGPGAVGADIDSALTTDGVPTSVRAASAIVADWAAGRRCSICGRSLSEPAAKHRSMTPRAAASAAGGGGSPKRAMIVEASPGASSARASAARLADGT